jgi:general secretion pathway protein C
VAGFAKSVKERLSRITLADAVVAVLVMLIIVQAVRLFWAAVTPIGPVGNWRPVAAASAGVDPAFDPFFRSAPGGGSAVTALPLKLFGVRLDSAMGRSSAIIATPDGIQSSFGLGEEVMPGTRLKMVLGDHVVLDRGGAEEQLFLDQSVPAPTAAPAVPVPPPAPVPAPPEVAPPSPPATAAPAPAAPVS